jgi:hypothetical protein
MKRSPLARVSARRKRKENPYIQREQVEVVPATVKPQREPWRLACGVWWPNRYVPEEPMKPHETCFRHMVEEQAHLFGWRTHHVHVSDYDKPGLPDLYLIPIKKSLIAAGKRPMWRELKVRNQDGKANTLSRHQKLFIADVTLAGGDAADWLYPDDWFGGRIDKELGL